jgi:hypothetical protein
MAINLQSPGIKITETDKVASVGSTGATTAGVVGAFSWGPVDAATLVTSEFDLVKKFGTPTTSNNVDFLTAAGYLAYSASEYVVRVVGASALNACDGTALLIKNDDAYETATLTTAGNWVAKYPGVLGNSIKVVTVANAAAYADSTNDAYRSFMDAAPGTSDFAAAVSGAGDELHVLVIDEDGGITGVPGTVLEKFIGVSKASNGRKIDGGSNYFVSVINNGSAYIKFANNPAFETTILVNWGVVAAGITFTDGDTGTTDTLVDSMAGGSDGVAVADAQRVIGLGLFANKLNLDIDVLICGQGGSVVADAAIVIAEARKDCVAVFSPGRADVVNNAGSEATAVATWAASISATSTYGIADSNWKYAFDKYNDTYAFVPCNADVAGCVARVDANSAPWFSPAGYENGRILNSVRLAWNPTETERDSLFKIGVNSILSQPGRGTVLFGDKTFTSKNTSFSRINVRRLFITVQSVVGDAAGDVLFGQNDVAARSGFSDLVTAYLRDVQGGRGISDYRVVCDSTNNPESVENANEFICDIYVRPIASVNFIQLNFVSVDGAAAFAELG